MPHFPVLELKKKKKSQVEEILNAISLTDRAKLDSGFGTSYSALACLPYFDTIHIPIIDPMHNLFQGNFFNIKDNLFHLNLFYLIYFIFPRSLI